MPRQSGYARLPELGGSPGKKHPEHNHEEHEGALKVPEDILSATFLRFGGRISLSLYLPPA